MKTKDCKINWSDKDVQSLTESFIDHVYEKYYKSYESESDYYEKLNNGLFTLVTIIGFLVTIILGLKEILPGVGVVFTIIAFVLPSLSSVILLFMAQKGYKKKEELREDARIQCKYLVNEAKIRFSAAKENVEFENIYKWLNEEVRQLQLNQANNYFGIHNNANLEVQIK